LDRVAPANALNQRRSRIRLGSADDALASAAMPLCENDESRARCRIATMPFASKTSIRAREARIDGELVRAEKLGKTA